MCILLFYTENVSHLSTFKTQTSVVACYDFSTAILFKIISNKYQSAFVRECLYTSLQLFPCFLKATVVQGLDFFEKATKSEELFPTHAASQNSFSMNFCAVCYGKDKQQYSSSKNMIF